MRVKYRRKMRLIFVQYISWNWGADIINGIVEGIKSKIQAVADAVTGVADKIKSFLHFSVPDEEPLTDFESWMPDCQPDK